MIEGQKVLLVKPQTFMNLSGESIGAILNFYKVEPETGLLVIYDDISLVPGRLVRLSLHDQSRRHARTLKGFLHPFALFFGKTAQHIISKIPSLRLLPHSDFNSLKLLGTFSLRGIAQVSGCIDTQKPHFIYSLMEEKNSGVIVTFEEQKARELYENYRFFDRDAVYYPAKDVLFYQSDIRGNLLTAERLTTIKALLERERVTVITTFDALINGKISRIPPRIENCPALST